MVGIALINTLGDVVVKGAEVWTSKKDTLFWKRSG